MNNSVSLGPAFGSAFFFALLVLILLFAFHVAYLALYICAFFVFIFAFCEILQFFFRPETRPDKRKKFFAVVQNVCSPLVSALVFLFIAITQTWYPILDNLAAMRIFFLVAFLFLFIATFAAIFSAELAFKVIKAKKKSAAEKVLK